MFILDVKAHICILRNTDFVCFRGVLEQKLLKGVHGMPLSFSECSTELLGDGVWLGQSVTERLHSLTREQLKTDGELCAHFVHVQILLGKMNMLLCYTSLCLSVDFSGVKHPCHQPCTLKTMVRKWWKHSHLFTCKTMRRPVYSRWTPWWCILNSVLPYHQWLKG